MATWEIVGEVRSPSHAGAVVPLSGGRALLTGVDSFNRRRVELYDPSIPNTLNKFTIVCDAPAPLRYHFAVTLADGLRVLVGGGGDFTDRMNLTRQCYIYHLTSDTWTAVTPLPLRSFWMFTRPAALLQDGRVIVTGGSTPDEAYPDPDYPMDDYIASRNVFIFTPPRDGTSLPGSWFEGEPMPTTRTFSEGPPHDVSIPTAPVPGVGLGKTIRAGRAGHEFPRFPRATPRPAVPSTFRQRACRGRSLPAAGDSFIVASAAIRTEGAAGNGCRKSR